MNNTCCLFGHREIEENQALKEKLYNIIENLIVKEKTDTFLFGSKSEFNSLCLKTVTELKEKHPHIKRIYVRAEYPYISDSYKNYLLENYEDTFYPEEIMSSKKAVYIRRNYYMIDMSSICLVYYNTEYTPPEKPQKSIFLPNRKSGSGTKLAFDYAKKKGKRIINILD